jgi:cobalt-zinc-cadmium efflux system membrane fusion protein
MVLGHVALVTRCRAPDEYDAPRIGPAGGAPAVSAPFVVSGRIAWDAARLRPVFSPVDGKIAAVSVEPGTRVIQGQRLAVIATAGHPLNDVHQAEADCIAAERDLARTRDIDFACAHFMWRDVKFKEETLVRARADLERARDKAKLFLAAGVDPITETLVLSSPIDGTVLAEGESSVGQEVHGPSSFACRGDCDRGASNSCRPCNEVFLVADLSRVFVSFNLSEDEASRVPVGARVLVDVPTSPGRTFGGQVDSVVVDAKAHVATVRGVIDNSDDALRPAMDVTVRVSTP